MESMNSRLDTLLGTLELTDRKVNTINNINNIFECNYEKAHQILEKEKKKSLKFIEKAISK